MKFSIITPCYNAEKYIKETIESVLNQTAIISGRAELEYIICDGGSTDKTLDLLRQYPEIKIISERDSGMYDALSKGLKIADSDFCAYINADDIYNKTAFDVVLDVFEQKDVKWITGINIIYNEKSQITRMFLPYKYRSRLIQTGYYGTKLGWIQQEATFWRTELNQLVDYERLKTFKYAGDYYLWYCFSQQEELAIVEAALGGFRISHGQLSSSHSDAYHAEMNSIRRTRTMMDNLLYLYDKQTWGKSDKYKRRRNKERLFVYDHDKQQWV